jgi:hypothetical protein
MWKVWAATGGSVAGLKVFRGVGWAEGPLLLVGELEQAAASRAAAARSVGTLREGLRTGLASS